MPSKTNLQLRGACDFCPATQLPIKRYGSFLKRTEASQRYFFLTSIDMKNALHLSKKLGATDAHSPTAELLCLLPLLSAQPNKIVDYANTDPALLVQVAKNAEALLPILTKGLSSIGLLLAYSAHELESDAFPSGMTEHLGRFIAEASEMTATLLPLIQGCRSHTADYAPPKPETVQPAFF
jgi:hypothetical protein